MKENKKAGKALNTKKSSGLDYSKTEVIADGVTKTPYITDQDNPQVKEYVEAVEKGTVPPSQVSGTPLPFAESSIKYHVYRKLDESVNRCECEKGKDHQDIDSPLLLNALYWIFDAFERSNMTFFLTYSTAESVLEQKDLEGDKITVGIRDMIWQSGARQIFDTYVQYKDKEDNKLTYIADNGVPVELTIFSDDECIMSPDTKMYHSEAFQLPNPYSRFLEVYK